MGDWYFVHVERIHLVWVALAITGGLLAAELMRRNALSEFLSPVMQPRLTARASNVRIGLRLGLVLASMIAAILALMQPRASGETETTSITRNSANVMFVLDTSRSMLAEDVAPTRLARAKAEIGKLVDLLDGQSVGLIAFAGRAALVCPLTPDHSFFRTALSTVDTRSAGRGGTRVGQAIKAAVRAFPEGAGAKLIVLITDGDDQDPYTEEAAKEAWKAGVRIVAIGFGSQEGSTITLVDPTTKARKTLMYEGKPVISKLDGAKLQNIALATKGVYVPAGTSAVDLDEIMERNVDPIVRSATQASIRDIPSEKFPVFVLLSLMFLLAALFVGSGTDRAALDRPSGRPGGAT